jgi:hypothetical protein
MLDTSAPDLVCSGAGGAPREAFAAFAKRRQPDFSKVAG